MPEDQTIVRKGCHWWQANTGGCGGDSCFSNSVHIKNVFEFQGTMVVDIQSAYATSLGTNRSPETLNTLAITILVFVTNRRKRGYIEAVSTTFGQYTLPPCVSKISETLAWSSHHSPSPSPSLKGKILTRILTRTVHIHPTRREGGVFSQSATIRVGSANQLFGRGATPLQLHSTFEI